MLNEDQMLRYSKQLMLKEIGIDGQKKLLNSKVLVIGAGGLGSPVLYYLACAGVGTLGLVDFDTIGISNLQRQILYSTKDIGKKKVEVAEDRLKGINPDVNIEKYSMRINVDNAKDIIKDYDIIVDATDNFQSRYIISDCSFLLRKTLVEGAVRGFEGTLFTIIPGKTPCYRCLYPSLSGSCVVTASNENGILGMIAGTIGSLQALEVVRLILGRGMIASGRMLYFDGFNLSFREIDIERVKNCPLCGDDWS